MAGLQRSAMSFRRQGSSGLVWDDRFLSGELVKLNNKEEGEQQRRRQQEEEEIEDGELEKVPGMKEMKTRKTVGSIDTIGRSRSRGGGHGLRAGKVSPENDEPPSPKLSACGFCGLFGKKGNKAGQRKTGANRRTR